MANPDKTHMHKNQNQLPNDILTDLVDAFNYYDKEGLGYISMPHFHNILHNFGYHAKSKNEKDIDLKRLDPDIMKRNAIDLESVKAFVSYRYKGGKFDEAHECFKLFDKKDKGTINA